MSTVGFITSLYLHRVAGALQCCGGLFMGSIAQVNAVNLQQLQFCYHNLQKIERDGRLFDGWLQIEGQYNKPYT